MSTGNSDSHNDVELRVIGLVSNTPAAKIAITVKSTHKAQLYSMDLGQSMTGWIKIETSGKRHQIQIFLNQSHH